jgi:hypothetical protein
MPAAPRALASFFAIVTGPPAAPTATTLLFLRQAGPKATVSQCERLASQTDAGAHGSRQLPPDKKR